MKSILFSTFVLLLAMACTTPQKKVSEKSVQPLFQQKDKEILEHIFTEFSEEKELPTSALIVKIGNFFMGIPYVSHTLETDKEQLVVNLRELDCTTFAENCFAISKTIKSGNSSFEQFAAELQKIRYHNGKIDGYSSRIHYFSDWIFEKDQEKIIKSVSKEIAETPYSNNVSFMSTHPESYAQLKNNSELIKVIAKQEKTISEREYYYIPEDKIAELEDKLLDGDIVGITTKIKGIGISHVGILVRKDGRIHLMHASSSAKKVVVSEKTLEGYLLNSKLATGIMVARPL
jgi:hypothetical protein